MGFSAEDAHNHPLPQAQDPHLSPCLTPVCTSTLVIMQGMHELYQPERVFQDPRKEEGLMEAQFIWGEEKEVEEEVEEEENEEEQEVEKEEEDQQQQQVEGGGASRGRRCSYLLLLPVRGTLEEVAAAATPSLPQSPLGVWPSPNAMAATLGSQYEENGLSRQDEVLSTSRDQEDARSWL